METLTRDELVRGLRPELDLPQVNGEMERFQNDVLRPILKFQNEWLIDQGRHYLQKRHKNFNLLKQSAQEQVVRQAGKHDPELRSAIIMAVASLLASDEHFFYLEHRHELNKRIISMGIQRLISQLDLLY